MTPAERSKKWREDNPERYKESKRRCYERNRKKYNETVSRWKKNNGNSADRALHLRKKYGMTIEQYNLMYETQGGICPLCLTKFDVLCVDHDHDTGKIRGLLCRGCNLALGSAKDSPDMLRRAADYLELNATKEQPNA